MHVPNAFGARKLVLLLDSGQDLIRIYDLLTQQQDHDAQLRISICQGSSKLRVSPQRFEQGCQLIIINAVQSTWREACRALIKRIYRRTVVAQQTLCPARNNAPNYLSIVSRRTPARSRRVSFVVIGREAGAQIKTFQEADVAGAVQVLIGAQVRSKRRTRACLSASISA